MERPCASVPMPCPPPPYMSLRPPIFVFGCEPVEWFEGKAMVGDVLPAAFCEDVVYLHVVVTVLESEGLSRTQEAVFTDAFLRQLDPGC